MGTEKRERQKANKALKYQEAEQKQSRRKRLRLIGIGVGAVAGVFLVAWIASIFVAGDDDEPTTPVPVETIAPSDTAPTATTETTEG